MNKKAKCDFRGRRIVVGVTGCIAAYKACDLVSKLRQAGAEVRVVMTRDACEFVRPLSFRTLSGKPVSVDIFCERVEFDPAHIGLAEWAEIMVIAPASANIVGKIAHGLADDLLSCVIMATTSPVLIAPAMNVNMWKNTVVQENVKGLKRHGYRFVGPEKGYLACGYEGMGRLASTEKIIEAIARIL